MRHRKRVFKTGRRPDHVRALLANQVCSLILEKRIQTTVTKAKEVRRLAEKMITLGKRGTLHHRRMAIAKLRQVRTVGVLFNEIAPRYVDRSGGYTRIIRLGFRPGDAAPMCYLELVEQESAKKARKRKSSPTASVTQTDKKSKDVLKGTEAKLAESAADDPTDISPPESSEIAQSKPSTDNLEEKTNDSAALGSSEDSSADESRQDEHKDKSPDDSTQASSNLPPEEGDNNVSGKDEDSKDK